MKTISRMAAGWLVVASLHCAGGFSVCAADPNPTIRVRVLNYTEVAPPTIAKAEREAGRILRDAGVNVVWLDCPVNQSPVKPADPCRLTLLPTDILLRVLSDHNRSGIQDDAFGFAVPPALASVYYEQAVRLARFDGAKYEVPVILASVMVHELGHVLLGPNSHSEFGIMQGQWGRKQVQQLMWGNLHFTPQQSKLIRAEGQMRMRLELAQLRVLNSSS